MNGIALFFGSLYAHQCKDSPCASTGTASKCLCLRMGGHLKYFTQASSTWCSENGQAGKSSESHPGLWAWWGSSRPSEGADSRRESPVVRTAEARFDSWSFSLPGGKEEAPTCFQFLLVVLPSSSRFSLWIKRLWCLSSSPQVPSEVLHRKCKV